MDEIHDTKKYDEQQNAYTPLYAMNIHFTYPC